MSIILTIEQVLLKNVPNIKQKNDKKMTLIIKNDRCGAFLISKIKFNRLQWDQKFKFITNFDENVQCSLVLGDQKTAHLQQNIIAQGKFFSKKFVNMFKNQLQLKNRNRQQFKYEITLYSKSKEQQLFAVIQMNLNIDLLKIHQGAILSQVNLDLRGQLQVNPRFVKFYLGKTENINLFNFLDDKSKNPNYRCLQSLYRDLQ